MSTEDPQSPNEPVEAVPETPAVVPEPPASVPETPAVEVPDAAAPPPAAQAVTPPPQAPPAAPPAAPLAAPAAAMPAYQAPPAYAPPANQYQQPPQNGVGTAALIVGILSFFCLGPIGSIVAIVLGKVGMNKADQGLATNGGQAKWGFWLGIVGLILAVIGIIIWIIIIAVAAANGDLEVNTTVG
jgi:hypothetical protein